MADSSGELHVLKPDGTPLASFNGGQPVRTRAYPNYHPGAPSYAQRRDPARGPAHARDRRHRRRPGAGDRRFGGRARLRLECRRLGGPGLPGPARPGAVAASGLARATTTSSAASSPRRRSATWTADGKLEIVMPALDQHVYAWDGSGNPLPGFPRKLRDPAIGGRRDHQHGGAGGHHGRRAAGHRQPDSRVRRQPDGARRPRAGGLPGGSATSSRTSSPTRSAAAAASTRSTQRHGPARLADEAERHRARRPAVRRPWRGPRAGQHRRRPAARGDRKRRLGRRDRDQRRRRQRGQDTTPSPPAASTSTSRR